jgi:UDP-glucose 4-epimerase
VARYLVTGGAGFIGSHLVDALLAAEHSVLVLDDFSTGKAENLAPGVQVLQGDVADPSVVRAAMAGMDGCFHLAAIASVARSNEDWLGTHRVNLGGTIAVLDAARRERCIPVVYASSAAVYGDVGDKVAHEGMPPRPLTAYGADKLGSELHAAVAHQVHGVSSVGLRFFNVYGPRQDPQSPYSGVISVFARRVAEGLGLTVHGDGQQTRDFVFVADVVAHLRAAMRRVGEHGGAGVFNVCTGRATSILELASQLGAPTIERGPARPGDIRHSRGDPWMAVSMLGVQAETQLADGLVTLL